VRFTTQDFFYILGDDVSTTYIGYTAEELAVACASFALAGPVEVHRIDRPFQGFIETNQAKEIGAAVWAEPDTPFDNPCLILGSPLVASGTARYVATISGGGPGVETFGLRATGSLADPATGAIVPYVAGARFVIYPDGTERLGNIFIRLSDGS
jgi:hypothetical protein